MAHFIVYGYKEDERMARSCLWCLARIRKGDDKVTFLDDTFNPCSSEFVAYAKSLGVEYTQTYHFRRGNLIGPEHTQNNFRLLEKYSRDDYQGIAVKVDCDTLVIGREWLDRFIADESKQVAAGFMSQCNYMFGLCYAIRHDTAKRLVDDLEQNPPFHSCLEDYEISYRVQNWNPDLFMRFHLAAPLSSKWACCPIEQLPQWDLLEVIDINRVAGRKQQTEGIMENIVRELKKRGEDNKAKPADTSIPPKTPSSTVDFSTLCSPYNIKEVKVDEKIAPESITVVG